MPHLRSSVCWTEGVDYRLRHPPWTGRGIIPEDEFLREVEEALAASGQWEASAEFRMGAGPSVAVSVCQPYERVAYRADAAWMDGPLRLSATYDTLDQALTALPLFGDALFEVLERGGWKGLIERPADSA